MEFRLTYEGPLLGATQSNTRAEHKHQIRKAFHPQLRRLWEVHPLLKERTLEVAGESQPATKVLAERFTLAGYNFVPLVTRDLRVLCELHVLFLRPDPPGEVLSSGDIDNRLKTLFDSLQIPKDISQLASVAGPDEEEKPFFCLLEDDGLVSKVSVETDLLLQDVNGGLLKNDARLIISVTLKPYVATWSNIGF